MVLAAYVITIGYGVFFYIVGASKILTIVAAAAFIIFLILGILYFYVDEKISHLYRIAITTVYFALSGLIILTGGIISPAFPQLLIVVILSFFYKPVRDRYFFAIVTVSTGILIGILTRYDILIENSVPSDHHYRFTLIAYLLLGIVFFAFIFIFSFAVRNAHRKLTNSLIELQATTQKLIDSEKMASLGQMMAGIAHEINNPINYIKGCSEQLDDVLSDLKDLESLRAKINARLKSEMSPVFNERYDEEIKKIEEFQKTIGYEQTWEAIRELLESIKIGSQKTVGIINSLNFYSRNHAESHDWFDVNQTINTTLKIVNHRLGTVELETTFAEDIPFITGSEGRVSQVIVNLFVNAVQACGDKGKVTLKTEYDHISDSVFIKISDTGKGIPKNIQKKIFDPFFTTKAAGEGTGLGLAITKDIIDVHGGEIDFETSRRGTIFTIKLPASKREDRSKAAADRRKTNGSKSRQLESTV